MLRTPAPLRIALVYVVAGALWIGVSDWLLLSLPPEHFRIGQEALDILASERRPLVHLLLTDAVMPGMSGRELIGRARELSADLAVLLMSGYTETELDPDSPYLSKPFTGEELVARVRQVLDPAVSER